MHEDTDTFTPEQVDEQIERLSVVPPFHAQTPEQRFVQKLQQTYGAGQETSQAVEHVWQSLESSYGHLMTPGASPASDSPAQNARISQRRKTRGDKGQVIQSQRSTSKGRGFARRLSLLIAVVCIGMLIGTTVLLLNIAHQAQVQHPTPAPKKLVQSASGGTPVPKPPHPITGGKCAIDTTVTYPQESKSNLPGLYIFAENEQSDNVLYRYDALTKQVVWSKKLCTNFEIVGTIEQNGILYLAGTDWTNTSTSGSVSYLYALNERDGSAIWGVQFPKNTVPLPPPSKGVPQDLGAIEMPTIVNGIVYVVQRSGVVYAFDAATGDQLWTFNTGRPGIVTSKHGDDGPILDPSSLQIVNGVAYGMIVDRVYALDARSGRKLWMYSFNNTLTVGHALTVADGTLYLTASVPDDMSATVFPASLYAFDTQTGKPEWNSARVPSGLTDPIVLKGKIYAMDPNARWYTFNPVSGAIEAQRTLPSGAGVPTLINGVLYDISATSLMALNPNG